MKGRAVMTVWALLFCSLPPTVLSGQDRASTAWWGSVGFGAGFVSSGADLASRLDATYQRGASIFSVRTTSVVSFIGIIISGFGGDAETAASDWGLLYGRATAPGTFHASLAAGVGAARIARDSAGVSQTIRRFTVPIEGQLAWRPVRFLGVVLAGFASVNGTRSFGGLTFGVQLGRLR
jgi:hypothetical protein